MDATIQIIERIISFSSDIFTIGISAIGIYLFIFKRDKISSAINLLLNYSLQLTLTDLYSKLDSLNDLNANDTAHRDKVINILSDMQGQIKGNKILNAELNVILITIDIYLDTPSKLKEPLKRSLVSELRENLRNIDSSKYKNIIGKNNYE